MKKYLPKRLLSLLLVVALLCGFAVPVQADQDHTAAETLSFEKLEESQAAPIRLHAAEEVEETEAASLYADGDIVRVSIVLEKASTLDKGFSTMGIANNAQAMTYRDSLKEAQADVTARIETTIGDSLDVRWNLTLAANIISANVPFGRIEEIAAVKGVKEVVLETRYEPAVYSVDENDPNMATSGKQTGSSLAWANGYTGLGSRVAIIDTGIDTDHQSFSAQGFDYALACEAESAGMDGEAYAGTLNLLDAEEIAGVADQLNVPAKYTADKLYINSKIPFGYNYIDEDLDVTHDNDTQGSHGSHVAGIAAANRYIPSEGGFSNALESVYVQGVAPDAQILAMKVFGKAGGAYDSDYFAAIEDAIVLGCDSVNLSLGTVAPGFTYNSTYQALLDSLADSDVVIVTSAGNNGGWADNTLNGVPYLYADDVNQQSGGSPGTYVNSLSVASVDNDGATGSYFSVGEASVVYTETAYTNKPFTTLAGEWEYILIDGIGTAGEWAALSNVIAGKIAVCSRGTTAFYEKANGAVQRGAIGVIIYNNTDGVINMDLTDYSYTAPVVSITQAEGAMMREAATAVKDGSGNVLYYKGTLNVHSEVGSSQYNSEYYTMSSFSSWGVAGSLIMKPEITAPGGNIYSVNGVDKSGTAYENMSGTSMSAPQVTGMVALVGQFLRENGLTEATGLSPRQLAQSLLMSTAVPLRDEASGSYWPVLQQGSGLANVGAAVSAQSYILMNEDATASCADGKVKAELGDDPERTGEYTFSFTIHNFSQTAKSYTLASDIFTQDIFAYEDALYLDTWTTPLGAGVTYTVDGKTFVPSSKVVCDLDGDGDTDADDAQIILNYAAGLRGEIDSMADVNGDGEITTYDAYRILDSMETKAITVAPGEKAEVTVKIVFSESLREALDAKYETGAYVEGFVFVQPVSTEEGEIVDVTHSIPVLGFYGNWSDPSMFEKGSYTEYLYGETRTPYLNNIQTNNLLIRYEGDNTSYWQTVNPYFVEEVYRPERAAVSANTTLAQYRNTMIRGAGATAWMVTDQDGKILYLSNPSGQTVGAWYYTNGAAWQNTVTATSLGRKVSALGVQDGDTIHVSLIAVPEYYTGGDGITKEALTGLINSGTLGQGAFLTTTLLVDSQAPEISEITKDPVTGNLTITARDNAYIAAVMVTSRSGVKTYAEGLPEQTEKNQTVSMELDLSGATIGKECLVQVADYAGNMSTYLVRYNGETEDYAGRMFGFTDAVLSKTSTWSLYDWQTLCQWMEINPDEVYLWYSSKWSFITQCMNGGTIQRGTSDIYVTAAEYVQGWVYMAASDGNLYVAEQGVWEDYTFVRRWSNDVTGIVDMSYNYADGKLYALAETDSDVNAIYTIDLYTGEMELAFTLTIQLPEGKTGNMALGNLAIDKEGNFWAINDENGNYNNLYGYTTSCYLFKWSGADIQDGAVTAIPVNNTTGGYTGGPWIGSMTWDHDTGTLYMAATNAGITEYNRMYVVNPTTGKASPSTSDAGGYGAPYAALLGSHYTGLYVVPSNASDDQILPVDQASKVDLDRTGVTVPVNTTFRLTESVYPWTLTDKSVTWSSSNPSVAVVTSRGVVTTVGVGTATITVTTNAAPHKTAICTVTAEPMDSIALTGLVYGDKLAWGDFDTADLTGWQTVAESDSPFVGGALIDDRIYAHDGAAMYVIDPETHEATILSSIVSMWQWSDAASFADIYPDYPLFGICNGGTFLELVSPESGSLMYIDFTEQFSEDPMAAIALESVGVNPDLAEAGTEVPEACYYMMTESGNLYKMYANAATGVTYTLVGNTGLNLGGVSHVGGGNYASLEYDEETRYLVLATNANTGENAIYAINLNNLDVTNVGNLGDDVTAVTTLYQYDRIRELTVQVTPKERRIFTGDTLQLKGRVLPTTYASQVVWTSSDTSVATVDENGIVTAVAPGVVTITATSMAVNEAGQTASASAVLTVSDYLDKALTFQAQVNTEDGSYWATIDTADLSKFTTNATATTTFTGAGAYNGKLYASNSDFIYMCNLYEVDPVTGQETVGSACSSYYAILDGATYPTNSMSEGNFLYLANAQFLLWLADYQQGQIWGFNLSGSYAELGAIAYGGVIEETDLNVKTRYYILKADGTLYSFRIIDFGDYSPTLLLDSAVNIGYSFNDYRALSMTFINDGVNTGLVVADASTGGGLYWIDLSGETVTFGKLGTLAGATSIVGLYTDADMAGTVTPVTGTPDTETARTSALSAPVSVTADLGPIEAETFHLYDTSVNVAGGSTNAAAAQITGERPTLERNAAGTEITEEAVTLTLTEDVDVTNGLVKVTYDPTQLTFRSAASTIGNTAVNVDETRGTITFAYATATAVKAGSPIASLTFGYKKDMVNTSVTVDTLERNDEVLENESVSVDIACEVGGHSYELTESKDPTCTEGGCKVYTCTKCGDSYREELEALGHSYAAVVTAPTCTEQGYTTHTCGRCGDSYVDGYTDALGHSYTAVITAPTCTERGYTTYTCAVCGDSYVDDHTDALGHDFDAWTVTREATCFRDGEESRSCKTCGETETRVVTRNGENCPSREFADLDTGKWYHEGVDYVLRNGLMIGMDEEKALFVPNGTLTRAQLVTILYRMAGEPSVESLKNPFTDVPSGKWYTDAIVWAAGEGIVNGTSATTFAPNAAITREQIAAILYRYSNAGPVKEDHLKDFSDAAQISKYAVDAMNWAVANGLIQGMNNGTLAPKATATRAQIATILMRYCG